MSKVSVIIPTYNCAKFLPDALDSVLKQTFQDFEIIVVDDGSTDNTRGLIKSYMDKHPGKINYVYQENMGLACARNTAIRHSKGEYIAILDADDMFMPNRLEEEIQAFERNPGIGVVHANISWLSEEGGVLSTPKRNKKVLSGNIFNAIFLRDAHVSISTILVKKECFDKAGLFDENLTRLGCEDRDMWLRISQHYPFLYIDNVLGLYRLRQGSMSKDQAKMLKARYYVINKFCPAGSLSLLRRKALSRIHKDQGDGFLVLGNRHSAKQEFLKSLKFWPFAVMSWLNLFKAASGK
ncbi:MAG: glycosyltransferase [Candidatus Omnitrophota bacterium]